MFCLKRAACAKAWKKEEHQGLNELKRGGLQCRREERASHLNAEGQGPRRPVRTGCLLVCKCINIF